MNENDKEFARKAILAWMQKQLSHSDDEYECNPEQSDKMNEIIALCQELEKMCDNCSIVRTEIVPRDIQGAIELLVTNDWEIGVPKETIDCFKRIVELSDGINISPFTDEMCHITFFVENVYIRKKA